MLELVAAVFEVREVTTEPGVVDGLPAGVFLEVGLGDVSAETAAVVDEHVIPRLLAGRLGLVGIIPRVARHAAGIDRDDDTAIAVVLVGHDDAEVVVDPRRGTAIHICESD